MGTTAQKLEYLGTTKSQLKDMINYGLDENKITSSTTFRNYVSSIKEAFLEALRTPDTLFTNLPKKSGSGSNISLNDTANAPMRITLSASELTQASTPTPSSPQDIHTISGSNKVIVCGKNLWNEDFEIAEYDTSGNKTSTTVWLVNKNKIVVKPNTTYTISQKEHPSQYRIIYFNGNTYISRENNNTNTTTGYTSYTFTTPSTCNRIYVQFRTTIERWSGGSSAVQIGDITEVQLELGNQATTYEPYISQEAEIDLGGKQLYNYFANALYNSSTTRVQTNNYISLPAGTYTISYSGANQVYAIYFDSTNTKVGETNWTTGALTFTFNTAYKYRFVFRKTRDAIIDATEVLNVMLNKGSTALPYQEYIEPINYSKIGNYEDKFIRTSGKNLFDENKTKDNFFYNSSGTTTTDNTNKFINMEIPLKSSYTISWGNKINGGGIIAYARICEYNENTFIKRTSIQDNNTTLTLDSNTTKVIASVDAGPNAYFVDLMINEGSTALPYEPYGSNEWYIKKNIGKVVLDGTEDYVKRSDIPNLTTTSCFRTSVNSTINANAISNVQQICDRFECLNNTNDVEHIRYTGAENYRFQIFIDKTRLSSDDASGMKNWATNNNMIIYYPIIPTYTKITGTLETQLENVYQKLLSYSGTTNISQVNNDLPFIMNVQAIEV